MRQKLATWLYKLVSGRELPGLTARKMEVVVIFPEAETMYQALVITDERVKELTQIVSREMVNGRPVHDILTDISKQCNHPNELAARCVVFGMEWEKGRQHPLLQLLSR